ncbi:MAG: helix-turn-helix transcriptional regulator, partial [Phycisphaerae bacterium]|nr:helix-turn-helix transcriptional regulator [Phycisphaerae bacterium]
MVSTVAPTEVRTDRRRTPRVWRALAHPVRRRVLDMLSEEARTTGEVCAAFPRLSRFAVMKHLRVLEAARLVLPRKDGRQVWNHLNAVPLREVYERWVGGEESKLAAAVLRLRDAAERAGPIGGSPDIAPPTHDRSGSVSRCADEARAEVVLPGEPGEVWPALRTRALADLARARFLDDMTIEGEWPDGAGAGKPVMVRVGVAPAA